MFPDDATAEAWFVKTRWANGIACPRCGSLGVYELLLVLWLLWSLSYCVFQLLFWQRHLPLGRGPIYAFFGVTGVIAENANPGATVYTDDHSSSLILSH